MDKNEFYKQASLRICGSLDIKVALKRLFSFLESTLPIDTIGLHLYNSGLNAVENIAKIHTRDENVGPVVAMPEGSGDFWNDFWSSPDEIEVINRPDLMKELMDISDLHGFDMNTSMIMMRLNIDGEPIGMFSMGIEGMNRYTKEHEEMILMLHKPIAIAMANALKHQEVLRLKDMLDDDNRFFQRQLLDMSGSEIIGTDFGLASVMQLIRQVAKLDSPVLLLGETGVGKGLIASAIHHASQRTEGPFINVNCGAIPDSLLDSELFGHEKGAFTGAVSQKRGRFERAEKGTIFLDEIGELPPQAQVRLLNVLQSKVIERVGGTQSVPVDIRIISATHRNLEEMTESGLFREDLWFRLNVFPIIIPPLRQRKDDIPALTHYFIEKKSIDLKIHEKPTLEKGALEMLMAYHWPGNVRELENMIERALIRHENGPLIIEDLIRKDKNDDAAIESVQDGGKLLSLDDANRVHIKRAIEVAGGKINGSGGAAELLSIHHNTLRRRMDKLKIPYKRKDK